MSKTFSNIVEDCISEFLKTECIYTFGDEKIDLCKIAKEYHILPIFFDWFFICWVRPNGEFVWYDLENPNKLKVEADQRIRNIAIVKGIEKFPQLSPFLPKQTVEDIKCPYCESTNQLPEEVRKGVTCYCGELGWIPNE